MAELTPMMRQYMEIKEQNQDSILFFRLGDFYEMFGADARTASVYVTSANALAETGEIVNIDGNGNRVSSTIFGHETVYFVVGENKITSDLPSAWDRARNIAAPKNAARLGKNTPCAADGVCHDCQSPQCICSVITVHRRKPSSCNAVVILVHESLGY